MDRTRFAIANYSYKLQKNTLTNLVGVVCISKLVSLKEGENSISIGLRYQFGSMKRTLTRTDTNRSENYN